MHGFSKKFIEIMAISYFYGRLKIHQVIEWKRIYTVGSVWSICIYVYSIAFFSFGIFVFICQSNSYWNLLNCNVCNLIWIVNCILICTFKMFLIWVVTWSCYPHKQAFYFMRYRLRFGFGFNQFQGDLTCLILNIFNWCVICVYLYLFVIIF